MEHPRTGTGKPKQLSGDRAGQWWRKISDKHRLVYEIQDHVVKVLVLSAWGHYDDKWFVVIHGTNMASLAPWFARRCWNSLTKGLWRIAYLQARSPSSPNMRVFCGFDKLLIIRNLAQWALFWRIWRCQFWSITLSVAPQNSMFRPSQLNVTRVSKHCSEGVNDFSWFH